MTSLSKPFISYVGRVEANRLSLLAVTFLFLVHLALGWYKFDGFTAVSDNFTGSESYTALAENLVNRGVYSRDGLLPTAYRPPAYPLFLATLLVFFGDGYQHAAVFVQMFASIALGFFLFRLSWELFQNRMAAVLSVLLYSFDLRFIFETQQKRETILFGLLLILFFNVLLRREKGIGSYLVLGVISALAYLTRPTGLLFLPIVILTIIWDFLKSARTAARLKQAVGYAVVSGVTSILLIAPWHVYVYKHFNTFSFTPASTSGQVLYEGNNPYFDVIFPWVRTEVQFQFISKMLEEANIVGELERDQYLRQQAIDYIVQHPGQTLRRSVVKLLALYSPIITPFGGGDIVAKDGGYVLVGFQLLPFKTNLPFAILTITMLAGCIGFGLKYLNRQTVQLYWPLLVFLGLVTLMHMVTYGKTRYRLPLDPLFFLLAGYFYAGVMP